MDEPADPPNTSAGFFGKVTTHGDFVSRRLPDSFRQPWDDWLQQSIQESRHLLGTGWLDTYLSSPIWRFALAPGICDGNAWAGVLMPSVDRVGRHFPLTIAAGVPGAAPLTAWMERGDDWYARMENLALSSLDEDFLLEAFDKAVQDIGPLPQASAGAPEQSTGLRFALPGLDELATIIPALTAQLARDALIGRSLWWSDGSIQVIPSVLVCRGLPTPLQFAGMLDGAWSQREWQVCG